MYVVLTGCTSDIIGDDVGSVTSGYQGEDRPIVYAETGGFKSNNYVSHETVVKAIIEQYTDKFREDGDGVIPGLVNVFATVPYQDPYWNGNLAELKRILEGIGLTVNILFGQDSEGLPEWRRIPAAQFNILANAWVGLEIVEMLQEKYGTPYFHFPYLPVGGAETSRFLRQTGEFAGLPREQVERFVRREEQRFYAHIERTADFMLEFRYGLPQRFYSLLDAGYAIGLSKFLLNELGIIPARQYIVDDTPERFQETVADQFRRISPWRQAEVFFQPDAGAIHQEIRSFAGKKPRALILGSGWERDLAAELEADLLTVSVPVTYRLVLNCGYAGYLGGLRLIEDIYDRVLNTYR
ncbi:Light-independent protochlorophyllide reductase subunit B [compost metagenome]